MPVTGWPAVTAVIPTLGERPDLLAEAVAAITGQDYQGPVECLVVLDRRAGAAPGPGLLAQTREAAAGARVLVNERAPGLAGTRNTGITAAAGEFVAFCDDDDTWRPGKLHAQVSALMAAPAAAMACAGIAVSYRDTTSERVYPHTEVTLAGLLRSRIAELHPSTFVLRREALLTEPGLGGVGLVSEDIPGGHAEDYELLLRAARTGKVLNVPQALVQVRWHSGRPAMQDRWAVVAEAIPWLLSRYPEFASEPAGYARMAGKTAFAAAAAGDRSAARAWARRAIRARAAEPRAYLALAVTSGVVRPAAVIHALHRLGRGL